MNEPLSVVCPDCQAAPGAPCVTLGRRVERPAHASREKAARRQARIDAARDIADQQRELGEVA